VEQPHTPKFAFQKAKLCLAKTRRGTTCQAPAANGKGRCRLHGGAKGSGAPLGNQNALKHGKYSKEAIELNIAIRLVEKHFKNGSFTKMDISEKFLGELKSNCIDFKNKFNNFLNKDFWL